jgi:predicted nuclease with RNAse H fold
LTYLGLDLTSSEKRPTAYAVLDVRGFLEECGTLRSDLDIRQWVLKAGASLVGMDCPLGLPRGLCCLEEECSCTPTSTLKGRECERELARRGVGCYFTTKRSIIKAMVYRGMALRDALAGRGIEVLEVYPYAAKVALWGKPIPPKTTPQGMGFLRERLGELIHGVTSYPERLTHDLCDAILAAYTAYLHSQGKTESLGIEEEAFIVVPKVG